ncbi:polysaccharide biosynthesis protein [Segatella bryantii]|jgi:FlaA1/EpsC-like NDP-sugar epimerase|uniref:polysaccharide biosynthesis protein n=1 Tax=Segatella bryantii TaxID=77095 RepID=UPI0008818883|nr:nucleoside-diphosphate sugar epimerase/dehydratase [Segatella bryantii]SDL59205.1 NDP-sugar epimerase, includes UDP-GlcNAc-inverting 4,6-dehydratase FlaA1 and capsular polysaccharide biosynthesis protein EpsC [Segatella bryantii]
MKLFDKIASWYLSKNALPYWCILIMDLSICYISGLFVFWMYNSGAVTLGNIVLLSKTIGIYMCFNLIGFKLFHTYSGIIRYTSFAELRLLVDAMLVSLTIAEVMHYFVYSWNLDFIRLRGRQIAAMYVVAMMGMVLARVLIKNLYDVSFRDANATRTMIYGIQGGGVGVAKSIRSEKPMKYLLKGFISQDPNNEAEMLMGEPVFHPGDGLIKYLKDENIQTVLVSPLQNHKFRDDQKVQDILINAGVTIYMAPKDGDIWTKGSVNVSDLKEVSIEDLLPRAQIHVDLKSIGLMLQDKKILVTGSAGSIGSEIVRQIAKFKPAELMLIDQAETPQHDIRLMMNHRFPHVKAKTVVTSICNQERMESIFASFRPDYVFHAAAYKHVPMMEDNPCICVQNNVGGTKIIADLSVKYGVKKFVMISTDKAVNPTNVMGCSKRICEIYTQSYNKVSSTEFVTTRFGNVLGSNGSVIPLFKKQIQQGGPVTVTDPNIIRFFMLISEACQLVLEAGTRGKGGQILVFDMGEPVKIVDLARRMISLSGAENIPIIFTGLRPGEKLYEETLSSKENTLPSFNDKIKIAKVREYEYKDVSKEIDDLIKISHTFDDMACVKKMKSIVPEFSSINSFYSILEKKA